jgi:hypothetical protein
VRRGGERERGVSNRTLSFRSCVQPMGLTLAPVDLSRAVAARFFGGQQ